MKHVLEYLETSGFFCVKYLSWKRFILNNYTMKIKREFAYLMQNYLMTKLLLSITS